jgi:hypothetical protein
VDYFDPASPSRRDNAYLESCSKRKRKYWVLQRNGTFKFKITPDRRNARQNLIYCLLPVPSHFSLPSTFKMQNEKFEAKVSDFLLQNEKNCVFFSCSEQCQVKWCGKTYIRSRGKEKNKMQNWKTFFPLKQKTMFFCFPRNCYYTPERQNITLLLSVVYFRIIRVPLSDEQI